MRRTAPAALALAAIAGALLAGCTPEPPAETTPPPTAEPTVSDEELATQMFEDYWDAFDSVQGQEVVDPAAFDEIASPDLAQQIAANVEQDYRAEFWSTGVPSLQTTTATRRDGALQVQYCADMTSVLPVLEGEVSERLPNSDVLIYEGTIETTDQSAVFVALTSGGPAETGSCS